MTTQRYLRAARACDAVFACAALVALSPVLLAVSGAIRIESKGPVLFRQERIGRDGRPFLIWKFRTMIPEENRAGRGPAASITRVGRTLRRSSIDELPQLINVFVGDMSLVGPRPILAHQVSRLNHDERVRLTIRPGITGAAQIAGRKTLTWDEKIALDVAYVRRKSFTTDMAVLLGTVGAVASTQGADPWRSEHAQHPVRVPAPATPEAGGSP